MVLACTLHVAEDVITASGDGERELNLLQVIRLTVSYVLQRRRWLVRLFAGDFGYYDGQEQRSFSSEKDIDRLLHSHFLPCFYFS